ncbi:UNVERIFIED_CONTAM: hypothetical protein FKN15_046121 [Acipenser sinensis]
MMMPFSMGSPWIPKFKGTGAEVKWGEWKREMSAMMRMQTLTEGQKVDFLVGALEGDAKRKILMLDRADRTTSQQVFDHFGELYGDTTPIAALRSSFLIADTIQPKLLGPLLSDSKNDVLGCGSGTLRD